MNKEYTINIQKQGNEKDGKMAWVYSPFKNIGIKPFNTDELRLYNDKEIQLSCQDSYDGSVNLLLSDGKNPMRLINSGFSKTEGNSYYIPKNTNSKYTETYIDQQTRLIKTTTTFPVIDLSNVKDGGSLWGGNYTFYIKYADLDENKTEFIAESGIVCIFKGSVDDVQSINGTLLDERTDKSIVLVISNIDTSYKKLFLYFKRCTSDLNGVNLNKFYRVNTAYNLDGTGNLTLTLTGSEDIIEDNEEILNIQNNIYSSEKTFTQVQNMLFIGNLHQSTPYASTLAEETLKGISIECEQLGRDEVGYIDSELYKDTSTCSYINEYYNPLNIYYRLGYWPDEFYRIGVVYIFNDGSTSVVYNILGGYLDEFNNEVNDSNNYGVIWIPKLNVYMNKSNNTKAVSPIGLKFTVSKELVATLEKYSIKGLFFVRQPRIPTTLFQGLTIPTHKYGHFPVLPDETTFGLTKYRIIKNPNYNPEYENSKPFKVEGYDDRWTLPEYGLNTYMQSTNNNYRHFEQVFPNLYGEFMTSLTISDHNNLIYNGILSTDAAIIPNIQNLLTLNRFSIIEQGEYNFKVNNNIYSCISKISNLTQYTNRKLKLIYVPSETPLKYINLSGFSTRIGSAESVQSFASACADKIKMDTTVMPIRGIFNPFIGVINDELQIQYQVTDKTYIETTSKGLGGTNEKDGTTGNKDWYTVVDPLKVVSVRNILNDNANTAMQDAIAVRKLDNSPYFAISNRYSINEIKTSYVDDSDAYVVPDIIYRGDCFTVTSTMRYISNFIDPSVPINDTMVDQNSWTSEETLSKMSREKWNDINRADVNAVKLGAWISYKSLSNYNIGLRSEDTSNPEEISKMGQPRSFYPLRGTSLKSCDKVPESFLLNLGYSTTLPGKKYFTLQDNYTNVDYTNRIAFSNIQVFTALINNYRVFEGLSYQDVENQYGSIVKLLPLGYNLFCVFEHGTAIIPINEKALLSTTTGQSIHMYGAGVLQPQVTVVSPDYGSCWTSSIIRTPNGIYGVDTTTNKIWRYNEAQGFLLLSDFKVQKFLNDNIDNSINTSIPTVGITNVVTHYNNYKNDVIFTFYTKDKEWSLCFNEKLNNFICRYTWCPLLSANIDNSLFTFNKNNEKILLEVWNQLNNSNSAKLCLVNSIDEPYQQWDDPYMNNIIQVKTVEQVSSWDLLSIETESGIIDKSSNLWDSAVSSIVNNNIILRYTYFINDLYLKLHFKYVINNIEHFIDYYIVKNYDNLSDNDKLRYRDKFSYYLYKHNTSLNNTPVSPTKWYDKTYPFEFEFVVNTPAGIQKIFSNLVMISNNVEPNSLEFEIVGDVYDFNKSGIFNNTDTITRFPKIDLSLDKNYKTNVVWDSLLNQYKLNIHQDCVNINTYGRRIGNITYLEDKWNTVIQPIYYEQGTKLCSTRIRDKYIKIRVKYSGDKLAVITAIQTLINLSYA